MWVVDQDAVEKAPDEERFDWMNDFENMYPTSYDQRHEELRVNYPQFYKEVEDVDS